MSFLSPVELQPLPLGSSTFSALRADNEIYVDKTALIFELCRQRSKVLLTRPRRFGKSLLVSTFESLFKYGLRDFSGLAIERLWKDAIYRVVRLDFSVLRSFADGKDFRRRLLLRLAAGFRAAGYGGAPDFIELSDWLARQADNSLVILIDEYDAPLTACLDKPELFVSIQKSLNEFYSTIKRLEGCLRFFFVTGVAKFSNTGIFSGFNNLTDISLFPQYGTLLGYTSKELSGYFAPYVRRAAQELGCSPEEVLRELQIHYDGFCFDEEASRHVFCPWSVLNFLNYPSRGYQNYWYQSGGKPAVLKKYLANHALEDPRSFGEAKAVRLDDLKASRPFNGLGLEILLCQAGYLTILSVENQTKVMLGFPNQEVRALMARLYADELLGGLVYRSPGGTALESLLAKGDVQAVVERFNLAFNAIDDRRHPVVDEAACRGYLQVLMMGAEAVPNVELQTAHGASALEVQDGKFRWIFEVKFARTADEEEGLLDQGIKRMRSRRCGETPCRSGMTLIRIVLVFSGPKRRFERWART